MKKTTSPSPMGGKGEDEGWTMTLVNVGDSENVAFNFRWPANIEAETRGHG